MTLTLRAAGTKHVAAPPAISATAPPATAPLTASAAVTSHSPTPRAAGPGVPPSSAAVTAAAPTAGCNASDLVATLRTDRAAYQPGVTVDAASQLRNNARTPCGAADDAVAVLAGGGSVVFNCYFQHAVRVAGTWSTIGAGQATADSCQWDQRDARSQTSARAMPGTYTIRAHWQDAHGMSWSASQVITLQP